MLHTGLHCVVQRLHSAAQGPSAAQGLHSAAQGLHLAAQGLHSGAQGLHMAAQGCRCTILQYMQYMAAGWLATGTPRIQSWLEMEGET